jgi:hypothetical protein
MPLLTAFKPFLLAVETLLVTESNLLYGLQIENIDAASFLFYNSFFKQNLRELPQKPPGLYINNIHATSTSRSLGKIFA